MKLIATLAFLFFYLPAVALAQEAAPPPVDLTILAGPVVALINAFVVIGATWAAAHYIPKLRQKKPVVLQSVAMVAGLLLPLAATALTNYFGAQIDFGPILTALSANVVPLAATGAVSGAAAIGTFHMVRENSSKRKAA